MDHLQSNYNFAETQLPFGEGMSRPCVSGQVVLDAVRRMYQQENVVTPSQRSLWARALPMHALMSLNHH